VHRALAGIRVPDSEFIRAVARAHGGALALTSANVSGGISTLAVEEFRELWPEVCSRAHASGPARLFCCALLQH
jgi:tRNA A37 threonylcarbamoyladenosine synthetase subunit TsaC/SUA5/YrdC